MMIRVQGASTSYNIFMTSSSSPSNICPSVSNASRFNSMLSAVSELCKSCYNWNTFVNSALFEIASF